jgi:hypothetical protein
MRSLALLALLPLHFSTPASAKPLHGELENSTCAFHGAEVVRWTPASGPLAAFVADTYFARTDVFIALGYDDEGFWSVEGDPGNDACESCGSLHLRHTSFSGERKLDVLLAQGRDADQESDQAKRRAALKKKIFRATRGPLELAALRQDYTLTLPAHDAEGKIEKFTGWFAQVKKKDGAVVRFAQVSEGFMCWCDTSWRAYTLAPPKKGGR